MMLGDSENDIEPAARQLGPHDLVSEATVFNAALEVVSVFLIIAYQDDLSLIRISEVFLPNLSTSFRIVGGMETFGLVHGCQWSFRWRLWVFDFKKHIKTII
jgi:hypothetical protein